MLLAKTLSYYKRREIQSLMVEHARGKEVGVRYSETFGKRPDVLQYESDVLDFAMKKATSFHCSEEIWSNPLNLKSESTRSDLDALRIGWDLILDIDCHHFVYSKLAAHILIRMLQDLGISSVTSKFSGNKGFHIAIPYEAFPETINGKPTKELFPDAPKRIAFYLRDKLKPFLEKAILKFEKGSIRKIVERTGIPHEKLVRHNNTDDKPELDVGAFLEIDTILIAPRHLYRMPYSLHEKSLLVSVPVNVNEILKFEKHMAEPERIKMSVPFLDRAKAVKGEASKLIINAFDSYPKEEEKQFERKEYALPEEAVPEEYFPPCIKTMLLGMQDGKKRTMFTLMNFLKGAGWTMDAVDQKIHEWNERNPERLREVLVKGQLRQSVKTREIVPPHNCKSYYEDLRVCNPDGFCSKIKNPLQYAKLKAEFVARDQKKTIRPRLTDEQKEMRRKYREAQKP